MPQGRGYGPNKYGFDPNQFQNVGFGAESPVGKPPDGGFDFSQFFDFSAPGLGTAAVGKGIDILGGLIGGESEEEKLAKERRKREGQEYRYRRGERVASAEERLKERERIEGTLGEDVFDPFAAAQFSLSATRGRRAKEAELISDQTGGELFAPDVLGALNEKLLPGLLEGIRSDFITNKMGVSQRDTQTRLALLRSAMSRFAGAQQRF